MVLLRGRNIARLVGRHLQGRDHSFVDDVELERSQERLVVTQFFQRRDDRRGPGGVAFDEDYLRIPEEAVKKMRAFAPHGVEHALATMVSVIDPLDERTRGDLEGHLTPPRSDQGRAEAFELHRLDSHCHVSHQEPQIIRGEAPRLTHADQKEFISLDLPGLFCTHQRHAEELPQPRADHPELEGSSEPGVQDVIELFRCADERQTPIPGGDGQGNLRLRQAAADDGNGDLDDRRLRFRLGSGLARRRGRSTTPSVAAERLRKTVEPPPTLPGSCPESFFGTGMDRLGVRFFFAMSVLGVSMIQAIKSACSFGLRRPLVTVTSCCLRTRFVRRVRAPRRWDDRHTMSGEPR